MPRSGRLSGSRMNGCGARAEHARARSSTVGLLIGPSPPSHSWRELMTRLQTDAKIAVKRGERELTGVGARSRRVRPCAHDRRAVRGTAAIDAAGQVYVFGSGVTPGCAAGFARWRRARAGTGVHAGDVIVQI